MYSIMVGYGTFYLVRQNFSYTIPSICNELSICKSDIGRVLSIGAILYGMGKFLFGLIGDRYSARYVMAIGLATSGLMNICLGASSWFPAIVLCLSLNQCFQSMGSPPCAKMLANWFGRSELGAKWGIWNTSLHIGGALAGLLSPWLLEHYSWRAVFYIPGIVAVIVSLIIFNRLRDTPKSLGFPSIDEIEGCNGKQTTPNKLDFKDTMKLTLSNGYVWIMGLANLFIYVNRMTFANWGPTLLQESRGNSVFLSGKQMALFELSGVLGPVIIGYISDKFFKNTRTAVATLCMILTALVNLLFLLEAKTSVLLSCFCMIGMGALATAPIVLINASLSETVNKSTIATAIGFTGTMGYLGSAIAGEGSARVAEKFSWDMVIIGTMCTAFIAATLFGMLWYKQAKNARNIDKV